MCNFNKLVKIFADVRRPDLLARYIGFCGHPLWKDAEHKQFSWALKLQLANPIMHSLDPEAQHADDVKHIVKKRDKLSNQKKQRYKQTLFRKLLKPPQRSGQKNMPSGWP